MCGKWLCGQCWDSDLCDGRKVVRARRGVDSDVGDGWWCGKCVGGDVGDVQKMLWAMMENEVGGVRCGRCVKSAVGDGGK